MNKEVNHSRSQQGRGVNDGGKDLQILQMQADTKIKVYSNRLK